MRELEQRPAGPTAALVCILALHPASLEGGQLSFGIRRASISAAMDFNAGLSRAFPSDHPPDMRIVSHECDECKRLQDDFAGSTWASVTESVIERHYADLPLFAPEAFRYFLPAFLRAAFAKPTSDIAEFLLHSLAPSGIHTSELSKFSAAQRDLVVTFLDHLRGVEAISDKAWAKARERWAPA